MQLVSLKTWIAKVGYAVSDVDAQLKTVLKPPGFESLLIMEQPRLYERISSLSAARALGRALPKT